MALYGLLALQEGGFNLLPFSEPAQRTISGQWEFLLMEAARLSDEASLGTPDEGPPPAEPEPVAPPQEIEQRTCIQEFVLFSGSGEVLHSWQSSQVDQRLALLRHIDAQAREITAVAPVGRLEQLEAIQDDTRTVCQVRMDRLLVVASAVEVEGAA